MNQYFSAIQPHFDFILDLDATPSPNHKLVTLGKDDMICLHDPNTHQVETYDLPSSHGYSTIALAPNGSECVLGGSSTSVTALKFEDKSMRKVCETMGEIHSVRYSSTGRYIAIGSQDMKCLVFDSETGKVQKCRPGHYSAIYNVFFSPDQKYVASIGKDQHLLIYSLHNDDQPQEVSRTPITKTQQCQQLVGSFDWQQPILYAPGLPEMQTLQIINSKWQASKSSNIKHHSNIIICQTIRASLVATCNQDTLCIWSLLKEEKLTMIEQFSLKKIVIVGSIFYGINGNEKLYLYDKHELKEPTKIEQPMDIEEEQANEKQVKEQLDQEERIQFEIDEEAEASQQEKEVSVDQHYIKAKKSKADKIITVFPQNMIAKTTQFYDNERFLLSNQYGYIIQKQEGQDQNTIQIQYNSDNQLRNQSYKKILFRNRSVHLFDMNHLLVLYATQEEYGVKCNLQSNHQSWERKGSNIQAVCIGVGWVAIASDEQIMILDYAGHEIRTICFDRQMVCLCAYENLLVAVYHESVPMYESQNLSMQIFVVDANKDTRMASNCHVPLRQNTLLKWFGFSQEGMIISQDSTGQIRAFSLQTNEWTPLIVTEAEQPKKVWIISVHHYQIQFWKTTETDPEPTVSPRFIVKKGKLNHMNAFYDDSPDTQKLAAFQWERYCLDHEKARNRLWGRHKLTRKKQSSFFYKQSENILSEEEITGRHMSLDEKYYDIVRKLLQNNQSQRALHLVKSQIRSIKVGKNFMDVFDDFKLRPLAADLDTFYEEREKQLEYEQMQAYSFAEMKQIAEKNIKPKSENPMKRNQIKKNHQSIPSLSSQNASQESFDMISEKSYFSQENNGPKQNQSFQSQQTGNPFLKKTSNHQSMENKQREIKEQVEKGIKKKVDDRLKTKKL